LWGGHVLEVPVWLFELVLAPIMQMQQEHTAGLSFDALVPTL